MSTVKMATCNAVSDGALRWGSWSIAGKSSVSSLVHSCTPCCHALSKRTPVTSWYAPARVARGSGRNENYNNTNTHWQTFPSERCWHETTVVLVHNCDWFPDAYAVMPLECCQDQLLIMWPHIARENYLSVFWVLENKAMCFLSFTQCSSKETVHVIVNKISGNLNEWLVTNKTW